MTQNAQQEPAAAMVDTKVVVNYWKVAPGENAGVWDDCRKGKCITINWLNDWNFDEVEKADIKRELSKRKDGRGGTPFIWRFVKDIEIEDIVIANNGLKRVEGIGIVRSDYLHPEHPRNPRRKMEKHRHARLVEWLITDSIDLDRKLFNQPTVEPVDWEQCAIIKLAYLEQDPKLKATLDRLFPAPSVVAEDVDEIANRRDITSTEKKTLIDARLGQGRFRKAVLRQWGQRCAVTSSATERAIRASHIKPWRDSKDDQRLDPNNGLPLIANLDALFDAGLISFEETGRMIVSSGLNAEERQIFGIVESSLTKKPTTKMAEFLAYHRKHAFKR